MRVLVVNAGSSSLKLSLVEAGRRLAEHTVDDWDGAGERDAVAEAVAGQDVDAVAHRVVNGGPERLSAQEVDDGLLGHLDADDSLAPQHNPRAALGVRELREVLPGVPEVACFDTTFFADLPAASATYALPRDWNRRWALRRFGAHGLSHAHAVRRAGELVGALPQDLRVVTCHLGSGASLAAVVGGRPVDTTMGLTPLEGLVMARRSGSVDPGLLVWLQRHRGVDVAELDDVLEHRSGLAGLSGTGGDLRDVLAAREAGDEDARLAYDVYLHRLVREAGAMAAAAGGLDVLAITGGVGEHQPRLRRDLGAALGHLGVTVDDGLNEAVTDGDRLIGTPVAAAATVVLHAGEDLEIARQTEALLV